MVGRVVTVKTPISSAGNFSQRSVGRFPQGFTLIELLVVLILAGILASIASVSIGRYSASASRQQWMDKMEAFVRSAHSLSLRQMCPVQLSLSPGRLDFSGCDQVNKTLQIPEPYGVRLFVNTIDENGRMSRQATNILWFVPKKPLSGGWVELMDGGSLIRSMDFRQSFAREDSQP